MPLLLKMLRCPGGLEPEQREVHGGAFSIGRGTECEWTLPDPDRVLSKLHCLIAARGEGWVITDSSSNGTFLNGISIDPDIPHPLRDGDRFAFGAYEFEAKFGNEPETSLFAAAPHRAGASGLLTEDRLTGDPFPQLDSDAVQVALPPVGLPRDFDPLQADDRVAENPYAAPDHTPDLRSNFKAPRPTFEMLPEDWDLDAPPEKVVPPQPAAPAPPPAAPPQPAPSPGPVAAMDGAAAFAAFAAGAGLAAPPPADPDAALRALGAAFRAVVSGLRRVMMARATIKVEFRIAQTMIRPAGNNPLKFAANDDDALASLLGTGRQGGMTPERAVTDALRDMRLHELAVAAAMQRAVREVLGELEPARVARSVRPGMLEGVFGLHKRRAWDAYEARYSTTMRALADDFDSVFGKTFVRAYEAALAGIAAQDEADGA
jgi:type VI secretion system FHA domain protein